MTAAAGNAAGAVRASGRTVGSALSSSAARRGSAVAIRCDGRALTFEELEQASGLIAAALTELGAQTGEPVGVFSRNSLEYALLLHGAAKAAVPVAHLNWRYGIEELAQCLRILSTRFVFVQPAMLENLARAVSTLPGDPPTIVLLPDGPAPETKPPAADLTWSEMLAMRRAPAPVLDIDPETCLHIVFTSGSTGVPKAAMISHRAMLARANVIAGDLGVTDEDAFIVWSPMCHIAGSDYTYITAILGGVTIIMPGFDAAAIAEVVADTQLGWLMAIPGAIRNLIEACRARAASGQWQPRVRAVGVMPDLIPPDDIAELTGLLNAPFLNSYGMTEAGLQPGAAANLPPGLKPHDFSKPQSPLCDVRIVDESMADVPDGRVGEMLLRAPTLFSGYLGRPEVNAEVFAGGWFHTGDLVRRTSGGRLDFVDRKTYMIKSGGENIYPAEIERVLVSHERIDEAAVVRAPSERWGQTPVAFIAVSDPRPNVGELRAWCRTRLSAFKIPSDFVFIEPYDIPRNISGKIDRSALEKYLPSANATGGARETRI